MGRNIPSITHRIDAKISQWDKFARLLPASERESYQELVSVIRNRRTAIGEADEADLGVAILLAVAAHLKNEIGRQ
jgi:hypothetical protein